MKKASFFRIMLFLTLALAGSVWAVGIVEVRGVQGKATDWRTPDTVMGNTTQLMTRSASGNDCKKSWLQFDLTELYAQNPSIQGNILDAKLTFYGAKSETGSKSYVVSGLNDSANLENWVASQLTWNNAPGNDINHGTALIPSLTTNLYSATIPVPVLNVMSETPEGSRAALTNFLNTDTDGKITFIFTAGSTTYLWNVGQPLEPILTLTYPLGQNLLKAHAPVPADDADVESSLSVLSWTNPEPNVPGQPIYCDVYLGTEPNRLLMDKVTLGNNISSVALTAANFPRFVPLTNFTRYYWVVDCYDQTKGKIDGEMWTFYTNDNQPPYNVSAGADQATWLVNGTALVTLTGTAQDDGLPIPPGQLSYLWERTAGPTTAVINSPNTAGTTVSFTETGDYTFRLTVSDSLETVTDTVRVVVGATSCAASHVFYNQPYNAADVNQDCIVDLTDLQTLIVNNWLVCDNTLEACN